jgi:Response regulator containing CheY-like receiver, AAA-type ATPase, and DNA-binding domains
MVLTDVQMPGGNGIDLLREIKRNDPNAVVLIMTGFGDKETVLEALRADADDFIQKPVNLLQLQTAIEKALGRRALKEELAAMHSLDSLKGAFLSLVSHKLKTPLPPCHWGLKSWNAMPHGCTRPRPVTCGWFQCGRTWRHFPAS